MRRQAASPADVLRLLKQPVGVSRLAVRAADYMNNALTLITSLKRRNKRSINATGWWSGHTSCFSPKPSSRQVCLVVRSAL